MKKRVKSNWSVYVLRCKDGSLYTGATTDIDRRLKMHNEGAGARYTRGRGPLILVHVEHKLSRSKALKRECAIKALSKKAKEVLVIQ